MISGKWFQRKRSFKNSQKIQKITNYWIKNKGGTPIQRI